ncbi:MAG: hypothetical protein ACYC3K_12260 [Candidatus Nanopelagicales bacterium]
MTPYDGTVVAVATSDYEVHLAKDGSCAWTVYPWSLGDNEERFDQMTGTIVAMGFKWCTESGYIDADSGQPGLTGGLEWDRWDVADLP